MLFVRVNERLQCPALFMLLERSSILLSSLITQFINLELVERMFMSCSWIRTTFILCSATAGLSPCSRRCTAGPMSDRFRFYNIFRAHCKYWDQCHPFRGRRILRDPQTWCNWTALRSRSWRSYRGFVLGWGDVLRQTESPKLLWHLRQCPPEHKPRHSRRQPPSFSSASEPEISPISFKFDRLYKYSFYTPHRTLHPPKKTL